MKAIDCYLTFNGNCREAMTFYAKYLGGELHMMPFSEMPERHPAGSENRIMHARIQKGPVTLMASDTLPSHPYQQGNNFSISVNCESKQEVDTLYAALKDGGKATMPCQDMFWGAYFGMLTDRFGVQWMFNFDKPRS